jgi:hypothetical protein
MAKLSFTKLGLAQNKAVKTINYNEQVIEVKQYLPVSEKLELISNVINYSVDTTNFANPLKISVYSVLEIISAYTNITFTEKQKEDVCKLYDCFVSNGLASIIMSTIPTDELYELLTGIEDSISAFYKHKSSVLGILESMNQDYSNVNFDLEEIQKTIQNGDGMNFLQEIMPLLNVHNDKD